MAVPHGNIAIKKVYKNTGEWHCISCYSRSFCPGQAAPVRTAFFLFPAHTGRLELLFPVRFSFDSQQFHIIIKISRAGRLKHHPFPVTVGFCLIVLPADSIRKGVPNSFKFCPFSLAKNNHKANAAAFCV